MPRRIVVAVLVSVLVGVGLVGVSAGPAQARHASTPAATPAATPTATPAAVPPAAPGTFVPVTPARVLDTAAGLGAAAPGGHARIRLQVAGRGGVPASGVSAVVLNLIVRNPTALGYLTVYPDGTTQPGTANIGFHPGPTATNLTIATVGSDGYVDIYNGAPTSQQLQADISGYYRAGTPTAAGAFVPVTPARVLDTAAGLGAAAPGGHARIRLQVAGRGGVPASGVSAVVLNLIVRNPTALGYLTVYPDGTTQPGTANIGFHPGPTATNLTIATVGSDGYVDIYNGAPTSQQLQADITGYYRAGTPTAAGAFVPVTPTRVLDTATGLGAHAPAGHGSIRVLIGGRGGVPASGVSAVVLNLIVSHPTALGYLTAYPEGTARPGTANAAFHPGPTTTNLAVAQVGAAGLLDIYNGAPSSQHLQADITGYYLSGPTVTGLLPNSGTPAGGTSVTVFGTGYVPGASVRFGSTPATRVTVASATQLSATAPAHTAGIAQVQVTTPSGSSAPTSAADFTYAAPVGAGTLSVVAGRCQFEAAGPATQACVGPRAVAVDAAGNLYIADSDGGYNDVVEKVTPGGTLSIVAGTGHFGFPTPGPATSSGLSNPTGVAVDSAGNLYIADSGNNVIEKVTPGGTLSIVAGTGGAGYPTPGPATSSNLNYPSAVALDSAGNLFIADSQNGVIEKVTPGGTLSIYAGTIGQQGSPTPGPATSSDLTFPTGVALDSAGNLYIADYSADVVERVTPGGTLSIVAGTGRYGPPTPGPATSSDLSIPSGVAADSAGNLYIADSGNDVIEKVTPGGTLSVVAGTGQQGPPTPGPATSSNLNFPTGVAVNSAGNLYLADTGVIEKVTPGGTLSIFAGTGGGGPPTPGPATNSYLGPPYGVAVDPAGNLYIADSDNSVIEKVTPGGTLSIVAGSGGSGPPTSGPATRSDLDHPTGVAVDAAGNLYIADTGNSVIEKVTPGGTLSIVAGSGGSNFPTPGPATRSDLNTPTGVAVDSAGNLYIADTGNSVIEKVTPGGTLSIVAGMDRYGFPTPGPATRSDLDHPTGVAVDSAGNLYVADTDNILIEKITPGGTLSIVAGAGDLGPPTSGPATRSDLGFPAGVAVDSAGNLYVADSSNNLVEKITPGGTLSIVAGTGHNGHPTPGPATSSNLSDPNGVAVDSAGNLYIADTANSDVEKVSF